MGKLENVTHQIQKSRKKESRQKKKKNTHSSKKGRVRAEFKRKIRQSKRARQEAKHVICKSQSKITWLRT